MKTKFVIKAFTALCILSLVLSGCSLNGGESESIYSEDSSNTPDDSNIIGNSGNDSENIGTIDYGSLSIKKFEKTVDSEGINLTDMVGDKNLYPFAMDNNYLYLGNGDYPVIYTGISRKDFSKTEIMTYDMDVEYPGYNKNTYCGCVFSFPCYGNPYSDVHMRALVGKVGEESKCILEKEVGTSIEAYPAELSDTEMVFACDSERKDGLSEELYKYRVGDEQAKLIYTLETNERGSIGVTCYNGEIYIIYKVNGSDTGLQEVSNRNETLLCVKRLNANGEEISSEIFKLPEFSYTTSLWDFTVTENNYIIRFAFPSTSETEAHNKSLVINRKSKKTSTYFTLGNRFNDYRIDDRYILFDYYDGSSKSNSQICVFDDKELEFHILSFTSLKDVNVCNVVADSKGDVLFVIKDDKEDINVKTDTFSMVLFEDVVSLIR